MIYFATPFFIILIAIGVIRYNNNQNSKIYRNYGYVKYNLIKEYDPKVCFKGFIETNLTTNLRSKLVYVAVDKNGIVVMKRKECAGVYFYKLKFADMERINYNKTKILNTTIQLHHKCENLDSPLVINVSPGINHYLSFIEREIRKSNQ